MRGEQPSRVEGVFDDRAQADQAIEALKQVGFEEEAIRTSEEGHLQSPSPGQEETLQAQNQAFFAWVGGIVCLLGGIIVVIALPAVNLSIQPVPLAIIAACAFAGYLIGGQIGRFFRFGYRIREHESIYSKSRVVVTVHAGKRLAECAEILRAHQAHVRAGPES